MSKCPPTFRRPGFTLTELLVVIVIIVALAAVISPMVLMLRSKAAVARSTSNLGQMKSAIFLYTTEYNGSFPYAAAQKKDDNGKWAFLGSWDAFLYNYIGLDTDPNHPGREGISPDAIGTTFDIFKHGNDKSIISNPKAFRRSYAMPTASGAITVAVWSEADSRVPHKISTVPDPARTLLLMERPGWADNTVARTGMAGVNHPADQISRQPKLNGDGKFQYLFADGHIEMLRPEETIGSGSMSQPKGMWTVAQGD